MKDSMKPCQHSLDEDVEYKEVVVIGNGPSGMVTSFMLAGNVPYLKKVPEDLPIDEMLRIRLSNLPEGVSLYEADLMELAEGLEGRSQNPIPLLMDNLFRPCADLGIMADPLIEWKYEADKEISHIVLGKGPPGGSWHTFPAGIRTLSPGSWLVLPPHSANTAARQSAAAVAKYCRRYVHHTNIQRYFRNNVVVTSVTSIEPPTATPCGPTCNLNARYQVTGYEVTRGCTFRYSCSRVVVCGGGSARPNTLPAVSRRHALYDLPQYDTAVKCITQHVSSPVVLVVGGGVSGADGVWGALRRGAGVLHVHRGPADTLARLDPNTYPDYTQVYKMMLNGHSTKYPNYTSYPNHVIIDVTSGSAPLGLQDEENYTFTPKLVTLLDLQTDTTFQVTVHLIGIFIGSKPDLSFLQTNFNLNNLDLDICECTSKVKRKLENKTYKNHWHYLKTMLGQGLQSCKSKYLNINDKCDCEIEDKIQCTCRDIFADGLGYGVDPKKPVETRNPIAIDRSTHEVLVSPKMYALGPLTADNFVRFIPGGALATVAHIHKDRYAL